MVLIKGKYYLTSLTEIFGSLAGFGKELDKFVKGTSIRYFSLRIKSLFSEAKYV